MANLFIDHPDKQDYITASNKAIAFIRSQMRTTPSGQPGRLPVSYLITGTSDPGYNSPSEAPIRNRCFLYDTGLALLVFSTSGEYTYCQSIMDRLRSLQTINVPMNNHLYGSFDSSFDFNTVGRLGDAPIYTGAMAWLIWGMCYYMLVNGNNSTNASANKTMIERAGDWLLKQQINNDPNYPNQNGLLKFGYMHNGSTYVEFSDRRISTEHQCSALQAFQGLFILTGNQNYNIAGNNTPDSNVPEWLKPTKGLYKEEVIDGVTYKRYQEGYGNSDWALDCCTWAGATAFNLLPSSGISPDRDVIVVGCEATAKSNRFYLTANISSSNNFNGHQPLSSPVEGFRPYGNNNSPSFIWTEGTLGYVHLCMLLNDTTEAIKFMNETIKLQNCIGSTGGVIYATNNSGDFHIRESVTSSAWMYLLINNPDVLFSKFPFITIKTQPVTNTSVPQGSITTLSVSAIVIGGSGSPSYQWYSNSSNSNIGGSAILGATSANFTIPSTLTVGSYYYFCEISYAGAVSIRSDVAKVNVVPLQYINYSISLDDGLTLNNPVTFQITANSNKFTVDWGSTTVDNSNRSANGQLFGFDNLGGLTDIQLMVIDTVNTNQQVGVTLLVFVEGAFVAQYFLGGLYLYTNNFIHYYFSSNLPQLELGVSLYFKLV